MKTSTSSSLRTVLLLILVLLLVASGWLWWIDAVAPVDSVDATPVIFVVSRGEDARSVAARLAREKLVRSPTGFFLLVKMRGIERSLQAGDFRLNRTMEASKVAQTLTHGTLDVWVTTLEGWRVEEVANKLAKVLDIPEAEFLRHASEGYMFPDTYLVPKDASPAAVAAIFRDTFDTKISTQLRADVAKTGLSLPEVVTLASIVEREGRTDEDRPIIAGILLKRLKADWPLQVDATLQYALGYQPTEKTWWKKYLTDEDKKSKSPFNTYANPGLPPHPIANPGIAAIKAVIYPKETDYWYYIHDTAGAAHYAKTIDEHNANVAKYILL